MRIRVSTWARAVLGVVALTATTVVLGTTPARADAPDCGATTYKSDGTPWTCTFADDFNGTSLDRTKWYVQLTASSGFSQGECFIDNPKNISVADGQLSLTLRKGSYTACSSPRGKFWTKYTSGSISTYGGFSQTYGRWEFRATFPQTTQPGEQSSLWMWPVANTYGPWPSSGEIDVAEWFGKYYDRAIPYLHYDGQYTDPNATNNYCTITWGVPHTFDLDWDTTGLTISYDGKVCLSDHAWLPAGMMTPKPFDQPFMIALSQLLGTGANKPTYLTPSTSTLKVDYVHVWS